MFFRAQISLSSFGQAVTLQAGVNLGLNAGNQISITSPLDTSGGNLSLTSGSGSTLSASVTTNALTAAGGLTLSGGTLTLGAASSTDSFAHSGGTLAGAGTLNVTGNMSALGGVLSGGNLAVQGTTTVSGLLFINNGATFTNSGTLVLQNSIDTSAGSGTLINNGLIRNPSNAIHGLQTTTFVSNNGTLRNEGTGLLALNGSGSYTFNGTTTLEGYGIQLRSAGAAFVFPDGSVVNRTAFANPNGAAYLDSPFSANVQVQAVSIGEEVRYELTTSIPVSRLRSFVIRDELPVGVRCTEAPVVNLSAAPYSAAGFVPGGTITPTCSNNLVTWNFGDQEVTRGTTNNRYDLRVSFIARVENTANTNTGGVIRNGGASTNVTAYYMNEAGQQVTLTYGEAAVVGQEPRITLTKAFSVASGDADDNVTVTVTATNAGTATAYNLRVLDDLAAVSDLAYVPGSISGTDMPDIVDTATLGANRPIFSFHDPQSQPVMRNLGWIKAAAVIAD